MFDVDTSRRSFFIKTAGAASVLYKLAGAPPKLKGAGPNDTIGVGFIGVGIRGSYHLDCALGIEGVEVLAVCDVDDKALYRAKRWVEAAGQPSPRLYGDNKTAFKALCERFVTMSHVPLAIFLGGAIAVLPIFLTRLRPGWVVTRHVVAIAQCLMSALLIHLTGGRIEPRFARLFLKLASEMGRPDRGGTFIPLSLSRQELADMTGTTIETCIRIMSRWGKAGVVSTERDGFVVRDEAELLRLTEA